MGRIQQVPRMAAFRWVHCCQVHALNPHDGMSQVEQLNKRVVVLTQRPVTVQDRHKFGCVIKSVCEKGKERQVWSKEVSN